MNINEVHWTFSYNGFKKEAKTKTLNVHNLNRLEFFHAVFAVFAVVLRKMSSAL